jgi:hypothetical protein
MTINIYPPQGSSSSNPVYVAIDGDQTDAFGRIRVSNPYTLFDSQARYAPDSAYSYQVSGSGAYTYQTNKSSVNLTVGTAVGQSVAQTYRSFPYQPGKSLLTLQTFTMAAAQTNLNQKVGYFSTNNGVYFMQSGSTLSFTIRTYTSGSVAETTVNQSSWNGDKLDGTGKSGLTLNPQVTQILFFDFEWLGVGTVRCGFIINGVYITCHTFYNANTTNTVVYMQTAILPLRYEINATGTITGTATLQQICSTVMSEGGYEQTSQQYIARQPSAVTLSSANTFYPLVAFQLNSSYLGAVVIPAQIYFQPFSSGTNYYEVVLVKNASLSAMTTTTGALCGGQVDLLLPTTPSAPTAISPSADSIVMVSYASAGSTSSTPLTTPSGFNWDLQLGVAAGASSSDTYTLAARSTTASNTCLGAVSFWNLTV